MLMPAYQHSLLATPCNGRCRLSIIHILHICVLLIYIAVEYVDPSISAFTATRHNTWQSTYTFGRQFATEVFVIL